MIRKEFQHKSKQLDSRLRQWKQAESEFIKETAVPTPRL